MLHMALISLHAACGVLAFAAGCLAVRRRSFFPVYLWSLAGLLVFLVLAVATDWAQLDPVARILFTVFAAFGGVMGWQALEARRTLPEAHAAPSAAYLDHLGFTLVALFDGFVVILAIDLGAVAWMAAVVGALGAVAGHLALRAVKARSASRAEATAGAAPARAHKPSGSDAGTP
jgi:hypothetical protein